MCIVSGDILRISNTKLLAYPMKDGRQLTAYSNTVKTEERVAMVLPFPNHNGGSVELVDLSDYKGLFEDLSYLTTDETYGFSSDSEVVSNSLQTLEVFEVGSFSVSIAENLEDLDRVENSVFNLENNVKGLLSTNYSKGFGFIVCIINESAEFHPLAYIHDKMPDGSGFIPTYHYHEHKDEVDDDDDDDKEERKKEFEAKRNEEFFKQIQNMTPLGFEAGNNNFSWKDFNERTGNKFLDFQEVVPGVNRNIRVDLDWDHTIYIVNSKETNLDLDSNESSLYSEVYMNERNIMDKKLNYLFSNNGRQRLNFEEIKGITKHKVLSGYKKNHDVLISF